MAGRERGAALADSRRLSHAYGGRGAFGEAVMRDIFPLGGPRRATRLSGAAAKIASWWSCSRQHALRVLSWPTFLVAGSAGPSLSGWGWQRDSEGARGLFPRDVFFGGRGRRSRMRRSWPAPLPRFAARPSPGSCFLFPRPQRRSPFTAREKAAPRLPRRRIPSQVLSLALNNPALSPPQCSSGLHLRRAVVWARRWSQTSWVQGASERSRPAR